MLPNHLKTHLQFLSVGQAQRKEERRRRLEEASSTPSSSSSHSPSSFQKSKEFTKKPGSSTSEKLVDLIVKEDWHSVRILLNQPNRFEAKDTILSCQYAIKPEKLISEDYNYIDIGNNAFQFACHYYPPWDVIKAIDKIHPDYIQQVDSAGRTVLHTAIQNGAEPQVVRYICAKNATLAGKCDIYGRTPLHYACKYYAEKFQSAKCKGAELQDAMRDVVRTVFRSSPKQLVNIEDIDECTALEYAIETDAPYKVVRYLQQACEADWKESSQSSGLDHETMKEDLIKYVNSSQRNLQIEMEKLGLSSRSLGQSRNLLSVMGDDAEPTTRAKQA